MNVHHRARLRKTPLFFLLVLVLYTFFRITEKSFQSELPKIPAQLGAQDSLQMEICRNIVDNRPFGVDSQFTEQKSRLYVYSLYTGKTQAKHIWFHETDTILNFDCPNTNLCVSSISPKQVVNGLWSVDFLSEGKLLAVRQFQVNPEKKDLQW